MATEIMHTFKSYKLMELLSEISIYEFFVLYEEAVKKKYNIGNKKPKEENATIYEGMPLEEYKRQKNG